MASNPQIPCLVCCGLTSHQTEKLKKEDEKDNVFECFHKMFLITKTNQRLWDIKNNKRKRFHPSASPMEFPFCKQCADDLLSVWELGKKLNELEHNLRVKLERSESQFEMGRTYQDDRRYYKIRHQILGANAKVKGRPSTRASKVEVTINQNQDNNEMNSPLNEVKIEINDEDVADYIKTEPLEINSADDDDDVVPFQFHSVFDEDDDVNDAPALPFLQKEEIEISYLPSSPQFCDDFDDDTECEPPSGLIEQGSSTSKVEENPYKHRTNKNKYRSGKDFWKEEKESLTETRLRKRNNSNKFEEEDDSELSAPSSDIGPDFDLPSEEEDVEVMCKTCHKVFSRPSSLQYHRNLFHPEAPKVVHNCPICEKPFHLKGHLKVHRWTHLNKEEKEQAISRGEQPGCHRRLFQCELCPSRFKAPNKLQRHQETVHVPIEERKELCPFCGDSFANLQGHIKRAHETTEEDKKHVCIYCSKRFYTLKELRSHKVVHSEKKEWKCDLCPREFALEEQLKKHMDSHLNIRPFQCQHCKCAFTRKAHLDRHNKVYHEDGGRNAKRPCFIRGPAKRKFRKNNKGGQ